jgi:sugar O-acyltransferase (sialic acid O-acetyltransferase NeuD family)
MKPLVIFGTGDIAELALWYFRNDTDREVAAFSVDPEYIEVAMLHGLPVVPFTEVAEAFSPDEHDMFVALSYSKLNAVRRAKVEAAQAVGYHLASYVSSRATVLNEGRIGRNCFILEDNTIQPFVQIGDNVTLWSGNHIGHHSTIEDHVFIASHAVISGGVTVGESSFVGVNATIRDHVTIGPHCVIGSGALILQDAEAEGVYMGTASERSRVPSTRLRGL